MPAQKKDPTRFGLKFNLDDDVQRQAMEILAQQSPRKMAAFIARAIVEHGQSAIAVTVLTEEITGRVLANIKKPAPRKKSGTQRTTEVEKVRKPPKIKICEDVKEDMEEDGTTSEQMHPCIESGEVMPIDDLLCAMRIFDSLTEEE